MVMGRWPTLHNENSAIIPARRALGHVEVVWYRESATKLTWELPGPRIVAVEHAVVSVVATRRWHPSLDQVTEARK